MVKHKYIWILFLGVILGQVSTFLMAQQLVLKNYDKTSGLPSNYITAIMQDRDGFIWFGSDHGISRYDGKSFITYDTRDGLPDNFITKIVQSSDGNIWISMYEHGVAKFDGKHFQSFTTAEGLNDNAIGNMLCDGYGRVFFLSHSGVSAYVNGQFTFVCPVSDYATGTILPNGAILFTNNDSIYRIDSSIDNSIQYRRVRSEHISGISTMGIFDKPSSIWGGGELFISSNEGVNVFKFMNDTTLIRVALYQINGRISEMVAEGDSAIWCSTFSNAINKITRDTVIHFDTKQGLLQQRVERMMRDYEGNLWFSTFGNGAQKLSTTSASIFRQSDGLPGNSVSEIFEDANHTMWFGTSTGLSFLENDSIYRVASHNLDMKEIRAITQDKYGDYYIGTFEYLFGPVTHADLLSEKSIRKVRIGYGVSGIFPISDSVLHAGRLPSVWVGSYGEGITRISGNNVRMYRMKEGICSNIIEDVIPGINSIWFPSHSTGVTTFSNDKFVTYSLRDGLPSNGVYSVYEETNSEHSKRIWFGTDNGLTLLNNGVARTYSTTDGLFGAPVVGIFPDTFFTSQHDTALWIVTPKGLHRILNGTLSFIGAFSFNQTGDLSINDVCLSSDNNLWCGTPQGVYKINLSTFQSKSNPPKVAITGVEQDTNVVFMHTYGANTGQSGEEHELLYNQNNLNFKYAGLGFVSEADMKFSYKLEPLDNAWSEPNGDNHIQFRNLADGEYRFAVVAINGDGITSSMPAYFSFKILPPYWKRWWFIASIIICAAGASIVTIRLLVKQKLRKQAEEFERRQAVQQERDRISRDLHDNVGAQLVNIISGLELAGRYSDVRQVETKTVLDSLKDDTRVTMALLRETIWALQSSEMSIEKFAIELEQYIRKQLKYHPQIKLTFNFEAGTTALLRPVEAINMLRIAQEALSNSLKHASPSTISVRVFIDSTSYLNLYMWNDGCLTVNDTIVSGRRGLPNMERRASEIGGTFQFVQHDENSASVEVCLPIKTISV